MKLVFSALFLSAALLGACSASDDPTKTNDADIPLEQMPLAGSAIPNDMDVDGQVVITVDRTIAEDAACLLMIDVANGTDETVTAGLFAFDVTGNDASAGANMFPQTAEPGQIATAQIVLPGADCDNALLIEGGEINCRIVETGESCIGSTELRDGAVAFEANDEAP